ncbi:hypothetical protein H072_4653 [Dactylellina haptotyla CBS 200.50]|uniref:NACHT domain-containing protein n=1 Tax=Dactylellina haptotyla (strain CBS 200.50) TaxID=1284197 RepID=S8AK08_DACHA|nr:hypothetical protein H072_4653 [Dactylellina haptotyla CBS 200.50]
MAVTATMPLSILQIPGTDPMSTACTRYASLLSEKELSQFKPATVDDLEEEVRRLEDHKLKKSMSFKIGKKIQPLVDFLRRHTDAVDTMVQANPFPAALVWGSLKVLLTLAFYHMNYFESLVKMLNEIGDTLDIYRQYEKVLKSSTLVQRKLELVYFDILCFFYKAKKVFQTRISLITARTVWRTFESDFGNIKESLRRHKRLLDETVNIERIMQLQQLNGEVQEIKEGVQDINLGVRGINVEVQELNARIGGIDSQLEGLRANQRAQSNAQDNPSLSMGSHNNIQTTQPTSPDQRMSIMNWVSNSDPESDFATECRRRVESSGEWLLCDDIFQTWQTSPERRILRIIGSPGAGKTVLSTTIIEHLQRTCPKIPEETVQKSKPNCTAFFYCSKSEQGQNLVSILAGIIKQTLSTLRWIPEPVIECFERSRAAGRSKLSLADNPEALLKKLSPLFSRFYLVIDGLDEISEVSDVANALVKLTDSLTNVHTVLLSRDITEITTNTANSSTIKLDGSNTSTDIGRYIKEEVARLPFDDLPEDICERLSKGANGMFLWASFMIKSLSQAVDRRHVMNILSSMPRGLDEFYAQTTIRLLEGPNSGLQDFARRVILLMCASSRPLEWSELECMLNTTENEQDWGAKKYPATVLKACSPLIENVTSDCGPNLPRKSVFKFAHLSVREFFLNAADKYLQIKETGFPFKEIEAHTEVARICLDYLLRSDKNKGPSRGLVSNDSDQPLVEYASTFWGFHIVRSTYSERLANKMHKYLSKSSRRQTWIAGQLFRASSGFPLQHLIKVQKQLHEWDIGENANKHKHERLDWIQDVGRILVDIDNAETSAGDLVGVESKISYFDKLMVIRDLSREYTIRNRLGEGEKWMNDALARKEALLGKDHIATVWLLSSLGIIYDQQHNTELSAKTHERALEIQEANLGSDHLETVWTINELGRVYRHLGRYDDAVSMHIRAYQILQNLLPADDLQLAWTLNTLARAYRKQGAISEALESHEKAIDIQKISLGEEHPHVLWALADIGRCHRDRGDLETSTVYHDMCLQGRKKVLGPDHPDTLWAMNDLGLVLSERGKLEEAKKLHEDALDGQIRHHGETHPHTAWSRKQIENISWGVIEEVSSDAE